MKGAAIVIALVAVHLSASIASVQATRPDVDLSNSPSAAPASTRPAANIGVMRLRVIDQQTKEPIAGLKVEGLARTRLRAVTDAALLDR